MEWRIPLGTWRALPPRERAEMRAHLHERRMREAHCNDWFDSQRKKDEAGIGPSPMDSYLRGLGLQTSSEQ